MADLTPFMNVNMAYPGIEIAPEISLLKEYLKHMESGIEAASQSYIKAGELEFSGCEYDEYRHVYETAESRLPDLIRSQAVVPIHALFEESVSRLLTFCQSQEKKNVALGDIKERTQIRKYNKYLRSELNFDFQFDETLKRDFKKLTAVRNCVAHSNGDPFSMRPSQRTYILKLIQNENGLNHGCHRLSVNSLFLYSSMDFVEKYVKQLMKHIEARYGYYWKHSD